MPAIYFLAMPRVRSIARSVAATLAGAVVLVACAEPPTREISQAQGALDAARAAGAEAYAKSEFQAADAALTKAHSAVAERDYRQALSFALDAREQARTAAREAAAARARAATTVALAIQTAARGVETARTRLAGPAGTRELRDRLGPALDELTTQLQEARSAVAAGDYPRAAERTRAIEERLAAVAADVPRR
jgi:predicted S18 family serine protease